MKSPPKSNLRANEGKKFLFGFALNVIGIHKSDNVGAMMSKRDFKRIGVNKLEISVFIHSTLDQSILCKSIQCN